jgi:hypothetical protein
MTPEQLVGIRLRILDQLINDLLWCDKCMLVDVISDVDIQMLEASVVNLRKYMEARDEIAAKDLLLRGQETETA